MTVVVLFEGYSKESNDNLEANCTCTLIKSNVNVIVDTMTAWDGPRIKEAIQKNGLSCEQIDYVVCTHGHSDHIGSNYLFSNAKHIVGYSISHRSTYYHENLFKSGKEFIINDKIKVIPTPGHTLQHVSVVVDDDHYGSVVIAGDLFENFEDLRNENIWINAGSDNEELQRINRNKILDIADYIIPGHGAMFEVLKQ